MDKIKTVKIKMPDGSISEETYNISVDAKNVDMANNKNLQETIGTINIDTDGNIAYQLENLKNDKVDKTDIIDNLNSTESNKVLSANQGKVLGDTITVLNENVNKKPYYYDTVADMKTDTKLKAGDMAVTLGYYSINDGGAAEYKIVSAISQIDYQEELNNSLYATLIIKNNIIIPEQFGAYGDNVHDDSEIIQYVFNNTPIKKPIKLCGQYKITTGIITNKPRNIWSEKENAGLYGSTNDYILKFAKDETESADYRNNYIKNIVIQQSGTGNGLMFSNWGARIIEMKIENCKLSVPYTGAVGYALYCENSLGHCVILGCNIQGNGIYGELQDANVIQKNLFFGQGNGIKLNIPAGCLNNTIRDNTIVNFGGNAIHIEKGDQILIDNNQIEYQGTYNQTTTTKGMIYITSDYSTSTRRCIHPTIINNNLGGGTYLDYLITLNNCSDAVIDNNRLVACNVAEIYIGSNTQNTQIRSGNYGISQTSNPRTDPNNRYIVENHGYNTTNYWNSIQIQNISGRTLSYMKDDNCFIHFKPCYLQSTSELTLCQLPVGSRPTQNIKFPCYVDSSDTQIMATINLNGTITLDSIPSAGVLYMPITYQAIKYS